MVGQVVLRVVAIVVDGFGIVGQVVEPEVVGVVPIGGRVPPIHSGTFISKSHPSISGLKYNPSGHSNELASPLLQT